VADIGRKEIGDGDYSFGSCPLFSVSYAALFQFKFVVILLFHVSSVRNTNLLVILREARVGKRISKIGIIAL